MIALIEEYPVIVALVLIGSSSVLTLVIQTFLTRYVGARADSMAADINLSRQLARTYADQEVRALALRLDTTRADGAMKILGIMAEIESTLFNWKLTAYFHQDELGEQETVEDLALRDLKQILQLLVTLIRETNSHSVLQGDEILVDVMTWVGSVHQLVFDFHAAYQASKRVNQGKTATHNDRVTTVSSLMQSEIYPRMNSLGELKKKIREKLSKSILRPLNELAA
jgi:hypothetical protein